MKRHPWVFGVIVVLIAVLPACTTSQYVAQRYIDWEDATPPPASEVAYRVFLLGDAGGASLDQPVLALLKTHLGQAGDSAAVVFVASQ